MLRQAVSCKAHRENIENRQVRYLATKRSKISNHRLTRSGLITSRGSLRFADRYLIVGQTEVPRAALRKVVEATFNPRSMASTEIKMQPPHTEPLLAAFALILLATFFSGCNKQGDAIAAADQADATAGNETLSIEEVKAIAEEGFIYGLPIVMNYTVNYEFWVDKASGQYKSGFNALKNEQRVFTYEDTAVVTPNSDTPYSFACLDLRAEPYVVSVPAVEKDRYFSLQFVDWNTFNYGYVGSRALFIGHNFGTIFAQ